MVRTLLGRPGHQHRGVAHGGMGNEGLRSVEDPLISVPDCRRLGAPGIGAGLRLSQAPGTDPLATRQPGQVLALELLRAEEVKVVGTQRIVGCNRKTDGSVRGADLL